MATAISLVGGTGSLQISGINKASFNTKYLIFRKEGKKKSGKVFVQTEIFTSYYLKRAIKNFEAWKIAYTSRT